ncbi:MAG: hypothetical protein IH628_11760, partial [Proteobacteria bacterium]|nr:hypothetical protein [Pseudomonadota bacterium]
MAETQQKNEQNSEDRQKDGRQKRPGSPPRPPQKRGQKQYREDEFNWNKVGRVVASWLGILLAVFVIMYAFKSNEESEYEISFNPTFLQLLNDSKFDEATISKVNLTDYDFHGKLKEPTDIVTASGKSVRSATRIFLTLPYSNIDDEIIKAWSDKGLKFTITK